MTNHFYPKADCVVQPKDVHYLAYDTFCVAILPLNAWLELGISRTCRLFMIWILMHSILRLRLVLINQRLIMPSFIWARFWIWIICLVYGLLLGLIGWVSLNFYWASVSLYQKPNLRGPNWCHAATTKQVFNQSIKEI